MKIFPLIILLNFYFLSSFSQIYSGQLINRESGQPILFANIGIIGKNIGTVSDTNGWFKIELNSKFDKDTLRISCIGYETRTYLIRDFKDNIGNNSQVKIELLIKSYLLEEVIIQPIDIKTYTLGNFCQSNSSYGNAFYSDILGTEIGVILNLPHKKHMAFLKNFRFHIGEFTFDKFPVRLNIYNLRNDQPFQNILVEPIFPEITSAGEYIIALENIIL